MNLQKKCRSYHCHEYFPAKPLEFKFFCDKEECKERSWYGFQTIKQNRHIPANYFDIYDLDRPIKYNDKIVGYERVCRVCGAPLLKKDGKYSHHKRYCNEHNGDALWTKYNWGYVSKDYAIKIREENQELICQKFKEQIEKENKLYKEIPEWVKKTTNLTICEECGKLCQIYSQPFLRNGLGLNTINIHHKIPVHKLERDNFHLIWDYTNLIALCEDCHHKQDHQLKTKVDPYIKNYQFYLKK
jgi:5-methylcytosine-specific restriction endonuclease McrA